MSRKCPFCKEEIELKETDCPYCHRVLIEKIYKSNPTEYKDLGNTNSNRTKTGDLAKSFKIRFINFFNFTKRFKPSQKNNYVYQYDKWKKYKKIFFLLVGVFIIVIFFYFNEEPKNQPINNNKIPAVIPTNNNINVNRTYISLPNGTVLNSAPLYLEGLGELKIENGIDLDAVAKLVKNYPKKSIYTVYIKAKSTYKISEISDGVYDLYFAHGRDWDKESQKFLVNNSYSKFEDNFDFTTKNEYQSDGVNRIYTTFKITLHPVVGGSAKTDTVSENEFSQF